MLQFQVDPAAMLAGVAALARPGGLVLFHELDWSGVSSDPPAPTYERLRGWLQAAIEQSGASTHMGLELPGVYAQAGLGDPQLRLEQRLGAGTSAVEVLERIAHLAATLEPRLAELGIASAGRARRRQSGRAHARRGRRRPQSGPLALAGGGVDVDVA